MWQTEINRNKKKKERMKGRQEGKEIDSRTKQHKNECKK
jgi:hypothetical protein